MKSIFTYFILFLFANASFINSTLAQAKKKNAPAAATPKVTIVTSVTDEKGRTRESTHVKTGKEAEKYLNEHPEIRNTPPNEWVTKRVTVLKRTKDPLTGRTREERFVKEGAEAENFDWKAAGINDIAIAKVKTGLRQQTDKHPMPHTPTNKNGIIAEDNDTNLVVEDNSDAENKAYLGVSASEMPSAKGVVIDFVLADSPAAKAGLTEWDIIYKVNEVAVHNAKELQQSLEPYEPSDRIKIDFWRGDIAQQATVTMESSDNLAQNPAVATLLPSHTSPPAPIPAARPASRSIAAPVVAPVATPTPIAATATTPTTIPTAEAKRAIPLKDFRLYPRPSVTGLFTVQFRLVKTDYVLLRIIGPDSRGDIVTREIKQFEGEYVYQIDVQKLKRGIYTLSLFHNGVEYLETLPYE